MLVRFAPSPTGRLHVGNVRTALVNFLLAQGQADSFVLRLDDTDTERSTEAFAHSIERDLQWLGISWGTKVRQSDRLDRYADVVRGLTAVGRIYPCYETAEELEYQRRRQRARGLPPIYDRKALHLTDAQKRAFEGEGRRAHWRFRLDPGLLEWTDMVRGHCHYDSAHLSDPVVIREDGSFLYMLPSVIDDVDMKITHVVRGEDHVTNTAVQIQMFRALEAEVPTFAHLPLLVDAEGKGLSKRLGSLSIDDLREEGIEAMAVNSLLARLGTSSPIEPIATMSELVDHFDIGGFARGCPRFDAGDLWRLNQKLLQAAPWSTVADRLQSLGCSPLEEAFWRAVRSNVSSFSEAVFWHHVVYDPVRPEGEGTAFLAAARDLLPSEPWDETTWTLWTDRMKSATGLKGKALFHPLRLALTGQENGPELKALLPLIGRARVLDRLA